MRPRVHEQARPARLQLNFLEQEGSPCASRTTIVAPADEGGALRKNLVPRSRRRETLFDINFLALGVDPDEAWRLASEGGRELKVGRDQRCYTPFIATRSLNRA
jgi:hypothetical protein